MQPFPRKRVLHLAMDYPSPNRPINTTAVRRFVRGNASLDYFVCILTRSANPWRCNVLEGDEQGDKNALAMRFWGLPLGILLFFSMTLVAWRLYRQVRQRELHFDAIHAHKMTFEGISAWWLARWLRIPLLLSVRGESDLKVLKFKPHYHCFFRRQLKDCAGLFFVSAYARPILNKRFTIETDKQHLLPNFVTHPPEIVDTTQSPHHVVTILDLNVFQKKGLDRLLPAFAQVIAQYPNARLDIIGRGSPASLKKVKNLIRQLRLDDAVSLLGELDNDALLAKLPAYGVMALPSHRETFGMVYLEALLCGVPILHSRGTGIDGFIDGIPSRAAVDPHSITEIRDGLLHLLENEGALKAWLYQHHEDIKESFSKEHYLAEYSLTIHRLCLKENDQLDQGAPISSQ